MNTADTLSKNERFHIAEGALYISTGALLSGQTMMPALVKRLGGGDVLIGAWPIVVYIAYFLPQVLAANSASASKFRKSMVLRFGFLQRIHLFILACVIALWGVSIPVFALISLFLLYLSNQAVSGSISPIWMDFLAKTTSPERRGKIMGWRTSLGAGLGLINAFLLTTILTLVSFPYNYASVIGLAFIFQMASLIAQKNVVEEVPSPVSAPMRLSDLLNHVRSMISGNRTFRKFLIASALMVLSFSAAAFFTVAAIKRFNLAESSVGIFTIFMIAGQILSGILMGWLADAKGTKSALLVCSGSLLASIGLAWWSPSVVWFYIVFIFFGINVGSETFMRYNFAVECAPEGERPMYIGLMNASLAPFYLISPFAGWLSASCGYNIVFILSLAVGTLGFVLLFQTPRPQSKKLALSSK